MSERADNPAPVAPRRPHQWERPTGTSDDPYAWMRNTDDPEFLAYLEAENAHTDTWFSNVAQLVNTIDGEIRSRIQESDVSAPYRHGPWFYASRTVEGMPYPMMCRGATAEQASDPAAALTVIDLNVEAAGAAFFDLGAFEPDPTHRLVAWSADTAGDEKTGSPVA